MTFSGKGTLDMSSTSGRLLGRTISPKLLLLLSLDGVLVRGRSDIFVFYKEAFEQKRRLNGRGTLYSFPKATKASRPIDDFVSSLLQMDSKESLNIRRVMLTLKYDFISLTMDDSITLMWSITHHRPKEDKQKFTYIEYKQGVLHMPQPAIHDSTMSIFLNLVAFDQSYPHYSGHINSYVSFMDGSINSRKDAEHLEKQVTIEHICGYDEDTKVSLHFSVQVFPSAHLQFLQFSKQSHEILYIAISHVGIKLESESWLVIVAMEQILMYPQPLSKIFVTLKLMN
ncbi:Protein of unknown function DUF247, plant [Dillenia turbinata]|uniref:Uncharacterized protein n=1 Tax=Dillenia turbinata TaxID=194707 RepID=A0AAN8US97_9MAGN